MKFMLSAFADEADSRLKQQITAMKENDISYLEIRGVDGTNIADITPSAAKEIRKQLDDAGIKVWSLGSPYGKINIQDDFAPHLNQFKRSLEVAEILGTNHIRLFSFYMPQDEPYDKYTHEVMHRLEQFVAASKGSNMILCHENEKGIYGDIASRCLEIHKHFPSVKAIFDPANFIQCGQDTVKAWELLAPYVEYMHIKDALPDGFVVPAGKGCGNIPYLLSQYQGTVLTIEPHLSVFEGFEALEAENQSIHSTFSYPSSRAAFDVAVNALKEIIV